MKRYNYEPIYRFKDDTIENKKILKKLLEEKIDFVYSAAEKVVKVRPEEISKALKLINIVKGTPILF